MRSSFSRSFAAVILILSAAFLLVGVSFQWLAKDFLTDTEVEELKNDAQVISELAQAAYTNGNVISHDFAVALSVTDAVSENDAIIFNEAGQLVMCSSAPLGCEHKGMSLGDAYYQRIIDEGCAVDTCILTDIYEEERYVVAMPIRNESQTLIGIVLVSTPTADTQRILTRISDIFLSVSILVIILSLVLSILIARQQSTPLRDLAAAARAFGHGELEARVKTEGSYSDEVQELALAFNNMAASLEKSEYQRQEFVANVSHELKTPMTTIAGYVDGILDGTIPENRQRYYLQVVSDETKRLNRLVRSMLDISRLRDVGGVPEEQKIHFDLCECVGQVLITFEQKILSKNLDIQVQMPEHPVYTIAHQDYVTQVVYNLVDNAVKFCPDGGVLSLTVQEGGNKAYISVANDGPTIPPEELPLVFDRFHKIDKSRSQNRDSWGLGLYIVKTIVDSHGENISITSREGRTTFTFTMPLVN